MSRPLSTAARRAAYGQQTGDDWLVLITIEHESLGTPIRVASGAASGHELDDRGNPVGYAMHDGDKYIEFPFQFALPEDREDEVVTAQIQVDNVDRVLVQALREAFGPPAVTVLVVMAKSPDTIEGGPFNFSLLQAEYDALIVSGMLGYEAVLDEAYPADRMVPSTNPGSF